MSQKAMWGQASCNIYTQKCWTFVLKALTMADDFDVDVEAMLEAPYRKEVS